MGHLDGDTVLDITLANTDTITLTVEEGAVYELALTGTFNGAAIVVYAGQSSPTADGYRFDVHHQTMFFSFRALGGQTSYTIENKTGSVNNIKVYARRLR